VLDGSRTPVPAPRRYASGVNAETLRAELAAERRALRWSAAWTAATFLGFAFGLSGQLTEHALFVNLGYGLAYLAGAGPAGLEALRALRRGALEIDLLMVLAALAAAAVGEPRDGAILLVLFSLSKTLEDGAMGRTRRAVAALMELRPDTARVVEHGVERELSADDVEVGARVLVRPGDRVPLDGVVEAGTSSLDRASITGESVPVDVAPGEEVFAGSVNGAGALTVRVSKRASDSTLSRMVALVTEAQAARAPSQRVSDWFGRRYTVFVLSGTALALAAFFAAGLSTETAFYRAATLLVVASPCAVVISVPAAVLSALAAAARRGVLFKGGGALEAFGAVEIVAFDKTGTLTQGAMAVHEVVARDGAPEALSVAAALEAVSEHPIARAVVAEARRLEVDFAPADDVRALPGFGVSGRWNGEEAWAGNRRLARERRASLGELASTIEAMEHGGRTVVVVGVGREVLGAIAVGDTPRVHAPEAIRSLRAGGVRRVAVLSGDHRAVTDAVARDVGIAAGDAYGDLMPDEKMDVVRRLQREGAVAYVGDGVNDAAALAIADVGVAMGAAGSDVALETADVALLSDDLRRLPEAHALARRANRVIRQNLVFALGIMAVMVVLTLMGRLPLPLGVIGHEGGTLLVVANGLRLMLGARPPAAPSAAAGVTEARVA
jgi:Zn2+/Cd2+-exporting ATPase